MQTGRARCSACVCITLPAMVMRDEEEPERAVLTKMEPIRWIALAALIVGRVLPENGLGLSLCPIKQWTGFPCLSCGLTRSFLHTLHGDWSGALQLHPLGPLLVAWCFAVATAPLVPSALRHRGGYWLGDPVRASRRLLPLAGALLILNGLYRLWWIVALGRPSMW